VILFQIIVQIQKNVNSGRSRRNGSMGWQMKTLTRKQAKKAFKKIEKGGK